MSQSPIDAQWRVFESRAATERAVLLSGFRRLGGGTYGLMCLKEEVGEPSLVGVNVSVLQTQPTAGLAGLETVVPGGDCQDRPWIVVGAGDDVLVRIGVGVGLGIPAALSNRQVRRDRLDGDLILVASEASVPIRLGIADKGGSEGTDPPTLAQGGVTGLPRSPDTTQGQRLFRHSRTRVDCAGDSVLDDAGLSGWAGSDAVTATTAATRKDSVRYADFRDELSPHMLREDVPPVPAACGPPAPRLLPSARAT